MEYIIGIDIGGTRIRSAIADLHGTIVHDMQTDTRAARGPNAIIDDVVSYIEQLRTMVPTDATIHGIGIGCPGPLDSEAGIIFAAPNLPGWRDVPLRHMVEERTLLPVQIANDANAAVMGEWYFGGGVGYHHIVYITVSTGIGSGMVTNGKLLLGHRGAGAELGHMIIDTTSKKTWEQLASGTALRRAAASAMRHYPKTALHALATPDTVTAHHVAHAATHGDAVSLDLMQQEADFLGVGFVNILHMFSPQIILVGGDVIIANPFLLQGARKVVQKHVIADVYRAVPITVAHLQDNVGVMGAIALFLTPPQQPQ